MFLEHLTVSVHDAKHIVYYKYRTLESRCSTLIQRRKYGRRWFYTALLPRRRIWEGEDDRRMVDLLIHGLKNFLSEDPFGGWQTCNSKFCGSRKKSVFLFRIRIWSGFNQVSGSRSAKMTHKNRKKLGNFMFLSTECSLLRVEGFSCSLDVLYGGQGMSKLQFQNFFQL